MIKLSLTLIFATIFITNIFSQKNYPDSLFSELKIAKEDTNKVILLNVIAKQTIYNDPDTAIYFCNQAIRLANKLNFSKGISLAFDISGIYYQNKGEYDKAKDFYQKSLDVRNKMDDPKLIAISFNNFGVLNRRIGEFSKSKEFFIKSLSISKDLDDTVALSRVHNNLGLLMDNMGNYEESINYHLLSLKEREKLDNMGDIASSLNNIGKVYFDIDNYDEALTYFMRSLKIKENLEDRRSLASTISNIGAVKFYQNKFGEAIDFNIRCLKIYESLGDKRNIGSILSNMAFIVKKMGDMKRAVSYNLRSIKILEEIGDMDKLCNSYNSMASTYYELRDYKKAHLYAKRAESIAIEKKILRELKSSLHWLYLIHTSLKDYKTANNYVVQYMDVKDTLLNETNINKIAELQTKYETEKKEQRIENLSKEKEIEILKNERSKYYIFSLVGLMVILTTIGILIFRNSRLNAKSNEIELEQRLLRSQMNPHFIFNAISSIQEYIMDNNPLEAGSYLSKFAGLMRSILDNSAREFISLDNEIETLQYYLQLQKMRFPDKMEYEIIVGDDIETDELVIPPMLSQPFIENAIKHGIEKKKDGVGKVTVGFSENNGSLLLKVQDNGIGLNNSEESKDKNHQSMATKITQTRIANFKKAYKKAVHFEIGNMVNDKNEIAGVQVIFKLPKKYLS